MLLESIVDTKSCVLAGEQMGDFQTYGIKDGKLVHISTVESGLSCGCICPNCSSILIARKGQRNKHSFAHYSRAQNCGGGQESALHIMAKEIIEKEKKVYIPPEGKALPGYIKTFDSVALEVRDYSGIVPDIIMRDDREVLNVEIRVKHAVDAEKRSKLKAANLRTIEIDLHDLIDDFTEETVAEAIWSEERSSWAYSLIVDKEERVQKARAALCDHLSCETQSQYWGEKIFCPLKKKSIWSGSDDGCHHACYYLDFDQYGKLEEDSSSNQVEAIPCRYREKNIKPEEVEDIKNLERRNGFIVAVDVLRHDTWEHWGGYSKSLLVRDYQPKEPSKSGQTVLDLWKPNYEWMAIENTETGEGMLIPGKNGSLLRQDFDPNGKILGHYAQGGDFRCYHQKLYVVWDAEKPIWLLLRAKEIEPKDNMPPANSPALSANYSIANNQDSSGHGQARPQRTNNPPKLQKEQPLIDLGKKDKQPVASSPEVKPKHQQSLTDRIGSQKKVNDSLHEMVFARCTICNRVDNARRFASYEGEGILKTGICNECNKRSKLHQIDENSLNRDN